MRNFVKNILNKIAPILEKQQKKLVPFLEKQQHKINYFLEKLSKKQGLSKLQKIPVNVHTILIFFAIVGIFGLFHLVVLTSKAAPIGLPISKPACSVYKNFIAAPGIIESSANNILLSPIVSGVVDKIYVRVGDAVKKGTPLFSTNLLQAESDWELKQAQVSFAKSSLKQAELQKKNSQKKFDLAKAIKDRRAISQDDYLTRENAAVIDKAAYEVAINNLKIAEAQEKVSKTNLDILTTLAPDDCQVLQINILPGEYSPTNVNTTTTPVMLLGKVDGMQIRIDIDETEAWRFKKGSNAIAYVRGNSDIKMDLKFNHVEPFVLPKTSLTGNATERVDTRVLQVVYEFNPIGLPIYVGQQVDVYIEDADIKQQVGL
jgi:multidrug efflux pump subunit AcrA (membrane-fusion protein)